jgi:hypothetical protein
VLNAEARPSWQTQDAMPHLQDTSDAGSQPWPWTLGTGRVPATEESPSHFMVRDPGHALYEVPLSIRGPMGRDGRSAHRCAPGNAWRLGRSELCQDKARSVRVRDAARASPGTGLVRTQSVRCGSEKAQILTGSQQMPTGLHGRLPKTCSA